MESASEAVQEDYEVVYYASEDDKVILKAVEETASQYEYVDLGLPSGTLWATCNVGATKPEEYGKFFQWGDTVGYYEGQGAEEHSTWAAAPFNNGASDYDSAYFASVSGNVLDLHDNANPTLKSKYDAAHVHMGGIWRIPTKEECQELINNTTSTWYDSGNIEFNGVSGVKFTNKSDSTKYIFVPAGGFFSYNSHNAAIYTGFYMSSSLDSIVNAIYMQNISYLNISSGNSIGVATAQQMFGMPIRAVLTSK